MWARFRRWAARMEPVEQAGWPVCMTCQKRFDPEGRKRRYFDVFDHAIVTQDWQHCVDCVQRYSIMVIGASGMHGSVPPSMVTPAALAYVQRCKEAQNG